MQINVSDRGAVLIGLGLLAVGVELTAPGTFMRLLEQFAGVVG